MSDLLASLTPIERIGEGAVLLRGFCANDGEALMRAVRAIEAEAPFRHMVTPGGRGMSVAMTNCGRTGWVTDLTGYRYEACDPTSAKPWPTMPDIFFDLARRAAAAGGYPNFEPDACLINRYEPGARMAPHQDKDERDFTAPIVSVSLGLPATFLWGGLARSDKTQRFTLHDCDVVVWGGPSRLVYHGVAPVKNGGRYNLTFRRAR